MNEMEQTALNVGIRIISKHKAAQLLALCLNIGDEPFVFNKKLHDDTMTAARLYGFYGMGIPDSELTQLVRQYTQSLYQLNASRWVQAINEQYGTAFPDYIPKIMNGQELWQSMHT